MHDLKYIRENPEAFDAGLARRGVAPQSAAILELDAKRRDVATRMQETQSHRNEASEAIGQAMGKGDTAAAEVLKEEVALLKQILPTLEKDDRTLSAQLTDMLAALPNIPANDVPPGEDEDANVEVSRWPKFCSDQRSFSFDPKEHADIGPALGLDFETGARISGSRFTFLRGQMARLHRALGQFMLNHQTSVHGYMECAPPLLVKNEAVYGTGQLPKFAEDLFSTQISIGDEHLSGMIEKSIAELRPKYPNEDDPFFTNVGRKVYDHVKEMNKSSKHSRRWLIPTAEVSLTNAVNGQILDNAQFPLRMTALTPCFRSEAGSAGKDTRGFIRQHQFEKVEMVTICRPEETQAEHERMTKAAESVLEELELPYRKMLLCAGDMGATARKTYDLEVWLPGQGAYREISSISQCGDFQGRRMNTRYKPEGAKKTQFVHTLNGSGLAVGRTLVAVLENYQQEDGSVDVPAALHPYMGGVTKLVPAS